MSGPGSLRSRLGAGLPGVFWWLWAGLLVNAVATFVFPFLALFLSSRGFTAEGAGLVVSVFGAGTALAGPFAGHLADVLGRRPTLLGSLLAAAALTLLLAVLRAPLAIGAAVLALGVALTSFRPALTAVVADVVPPPDRTRAFGLNYWAHNLGIAIAFAAGGALAEHGYGLLFLADASTTLIFAGLVWRKIPETRPPARPASDPGRSGGGYRAVLRDRVLLAFLGVQQLFQLVFLQFQVAAPLDMAAHGLGPGAVGRVLAVNGLLIVTLQPFAARLTRRVDGARVLAAAAVLVGAGYGAYALCRTPWHYAGATALWSLGEILALPLSAAVVADLSPEDLRGRYQGLYDLTWGVAMLAAPVLGSVLFQRGGPAALWAACLGLGLVTAAGHLAIGGPRRRRLAALRAGASRAITPP